MLDKKSLKHNVGFFIGYIADSKRWFTAEQKALWMWTD